MNKNRPVNLDLRTIQQPLPAITSILHRITGVALFVGLVFVVCAFDLSLESQQGFDQVAGLLEENFFAKLVAWGMLSALLFHLIAGVKHLMMDCGFFEELASARIAAKATLVLGLGAVLFAGVWVW